jgi:hypothetical protein
MNKLVLAATLALTLGASVNANICTPADAPPPKGGALVYDVSVKIKTTKAMPLSTKVAKGTICTPNDDVPEVFCYRDVTSKTLGGFMYACTNTCEGFAENALLTLWNTKEKAIYAEDELVDWSAFWRIGKNAQRAEVAWSADGEGMEGMSAQGFGTWNRNAGRLTSANGNILFVLNPPAKVSSKKPLWVLDGEEICACVGDAMLCTGAWADADFTVGFGTWRMKFNNNASARWYNNGILPYPRNWDNFVSYELMSGDGAGE